MIIDKFEEQVKKHPHKLAVKTETGGFTYKELNRLSNGIADKIKSISNGRKGIRIGLLLDDEWEMIAAILGTLKSGNMYVPLVKDFPVKRIQYIIQHGEIGIFVTDNKNIELLSEASGNQHTCFVMIEEIKTQAVSDELTFAREIHSDSNAYLLYTSGSTGFPKGVRQTHRNVLYFISQYTRNLGLTSRDNLTSLASFSHDVSTIDIYSALLNGATLFPLNLKKDGMFTTLYRWLKRENITVWHSVPTVYRYFIAGQAGQLSLPHLRYIVLGGESVSPKDIEKFNIFFGNSRNPGGCQVYTLYGQTESSYNSGRFFTAGTPVEDITITLGKVNEGTEMIVVDEDNNEVDPLEIGEIVVIGNHLSPGYWKETQSNREKFRDIGDRRVYYTGDLGSPLINGEIEFLGRKDNQVKLRGFRIELEEIENVMMQYEYITQVSVILVETESKDSHEGFLAAYFAAQKDIDLHSLGEFLRERLLDYMIPSYFKQLEKLPVTVSGKIDRGALPSPEVTLGEEYVIPSNEIEKKLVEIWADVLKIGQEVIGRNSNFFQMGGHSLRATELTEKIHRELDVKVPLAEVFERQTVKELSQYIEQAAQSKYIGIPPAEKKEYYPQSSVQKRIYFLQQLEPESTAYNTPYFFVIGEHTDKERLEDTLRLLIQRHESLRTTYEVIDQEPVQIVHDGDSFDFGIDYYEAEPEKARRVIKDFVYPFDLAKTPLIRIGLLKVEGTYTLLIDTHHIIGDHTALNILEFEYMALFEGRQLPELKLHCKDYSEWSRSDGQRAVLDRQGEYWLKTLEGEGPLPVLELPYDYPRPALQSFEGRTLSLILGKEETKNLKEMAGELDVTLFMMVLSAFCILISRLSSQEDIIVGIPIAARKHADAQQIIGMFVNTIPLRNRLSGEQSFLDFLNKVKKNTIAAYENQEYPFEELAANLSLPKDTARNPVFDVVFNMIDERHHKGETTEITEENTMAALKDTSKFDLSLAVLDRGVNLLLRFEYCTRLFKAETIKRITCYFRNILSSVLANPAVNLSHMEIMTESEKAKILEMSSGVQGGLDRGKTIHQLFEEQAEKNPARVITSELRKRNIHLTYNELNQKSNRIGRVLQEKGVMPDTVVGIMSGRSVEMIIGILGILKAGGAYLSIDPAYPQERVDYILKDSHAKVLLSNDINNINEPIVSNFEFRASNLSSSELAYIIYTSGSTGKPKGVMVEHRSVVSLVKNTDYIEFNQNGRILQTGALEFDASTFEIWGALLNGLTLCLMGVEGILAADRLKESMRKYDICTMWMTAPLFNRMLQADIEIFSGLRFLLVGGDVVSPIHINRLRERFPGLKVINGYGPTENTTFSTTFPIDKEYKENIPIGKPIADSFAYILDRYNRLLPINVPGELCVGGAGMARGYLNNPELTNEKFSPVASVAKKIYRTGDLARWMADGWIEFLGRMDHQVKIRGFRIEPGEIESRLLEKEEIKDAVVKVKEDVNGNKFLCAYIVCHPEVTSPAPEMREFLSARLPDYMIPSYFVQLDKIPLTSNGKIDRKALPTPEIKPGDGYAAPRDKVEEILVEIWNEVIGLHSSAGGIGIDDNFFDLGGHSLMAITMVSRIHKAFDVKIPLAEFFKNPFIGKLSGYIKKAAKDRYISIEPVEEKEYYPVSSAQKRLYIIYRMDPAGTGYNMPQIIQLEGEYDWKIMATASRQLIHRHESLRTSFEIMGKEPVQKVHREQEVDFQFEYHDLMSGESKTGNGGFVESGVQRLAQEFIRPFDLSRAPLFRVGLIKTGVTTYILMVDLHHIVTDGTSQEMLVNESLALYGGQQLGALRLHYKDFALWQSDRLISGEMKKQEDFWLKQLEAPLPVLEIPMDFERPRVQRMEGNYLNFTISTTEARTLRAMAKREGATMFMVLLALLNCLLSKLGDLEDIIVGTVVAGRGHADLEKIIGMFVNTLALRNYPGGNKTFIEFLREVKQRTLAAFDNQDYQFEELVEKVLEDRDTGRNPIFDVLYTFEAREPGADLDRIEDKNETPGIQREPQLDVGGQVKFDMIFSGGDTGRHLEMAVKYRTNLFRKETVERYINYFREIVHIVVENENIQLKDIDITTIFAAASKDTFHVNESEFEF